MVQAPARTLEVGHVLRAHGLRGELRVRLHWEGSDALLRASRVWLKKGNASEAFGIEVARATPGGVLVKLEGIDDRNAAESLRGAQVLVERDEVPLEEGEYYLADLIGSKVTAPDGVVGVVERIGLHPSIDTLVIRTPEGALLEQPIGERWVCRVDPEARIVELSTREGLI